MAKQQDTSQAGAVGRAVSYFQEAWQELKKVHPPTKQETIQGTVGVLMMVFFFGLFLGLADNLVGTLMEWVLGTGPQA